MKIPSYYLRRPAAELTPALAAEFDDLLARAVADGPSTPIDYTLAAPKWQFLCYLADHKHIVIHGSGQTDIAEFEPRQSNDVDEFGNRKAVYAASDGIWPLYFAILDRQRAGSLINGCFRVGDDETGWSDPYYFFSINDDGLAQKPWQNGMIYLLPRDTFEHQQRYNDDGATIEIAQWASLVPVTPLARLAVEPHDFPFLAQMRGHDIEAVRRRIDRNPNGFPWVED